MIVLALAAALAAPPAIASTQAPAAAGATAARTGAETRIPGTWMRLGDTEETILARALFPVVPSPKGSDTVLRQGNAFWFGIAGQVTLYFRDQRLEQAEFKIEEAAPYQVDYARDQLRLAGYRSRCEQDEPTVQRCDWYGATNVRLDLKEHHLLAKIAPAEPPAEPAAHARPPAARRDTVPVFPQMFVLGRGAPAGVRPPALADSTPLVSPPYPQLAREAGVQGRVWVRALVDTSGVVEAVQVVHSIPELDSVAVAVARRCRFRPYESDGARVRFRVEIPVLFVAR